MAGETSWYRALRPKQLAVVVGRLICGCFCVNVVVWKIGAWRRMCDEVSTVC